MICVLYESPVEALGVVAGFLQEAPELLQAVHPVVVAAPEEHPAPARLGDAGVAVHLPHPVHSLNSGVQYKDKFSTFY